MSEENTDLNDATNSTQPNKVVSWKTIGYQFLFILFWLLIIGGSDFASKSHWLNSRSEFVEILVTVSMFFAIATAVAFIVNLFKKLTGYPIQNTKE